MKYTVLVSQTAEGLATKVNEYIGIGWRPTGGVAFALVPGNTYFCQAMVAGE